MSYQGPGEPNPFGPPPPAGGFPPPPGPYGAPGYGPQPGYGAPYGAPFGPPPAPSNGTAIGALVVGIISLVISFVPFFGYVGGLGALIGIGLGVAGISQSNKPRGTGKGMAVGGIATSIGAILVCVAWTVLFVVAANEVDNEFDDINSDPPDGICNEDRFLQDPDC